MKLWISLIIGAIFLLMSTADAQASGVNSAAVQVIVVESTGRALFTITASTLPAWPSCAATAQRYAIDTTTAAGQAVYSAVLTAQRTHAAMDVSGSGVCDLWGDSETVIYVQIHP